MDGVLSPLESAKFIVENSSLIQINQEGVDRVANLIIESLENNTFSEVEFSAHVLHPKDGGKKSVDWVFLMDTINFSFWPDAGQKYDVSYKDRAYTGYFAGCAAVNKAMEAGIDMTSAEWMAQATKENVKRIFMSDSGHSIPLLEERVKVINDSGHVLLKKFNGSFYNCVLAAEKSAEKLLKIIVENFESFRDFATFKEQRVSLLKRAQILVADVYGALKGVDENGDFPDIGILTMFADYRVPQALAYLGALNYSTELIMCLEEGTWLENGSPEEVELRGASIFACQKVVESIERLKKPECRTVFAADVDIFVWVYRRNHAADIEKTVPFHRTRCIYY